MENYQELVGILALTMGVSWASGINLYAAILMLGLLGSTGNIELPANLEVLQNPLVIGAAGLMYVTEFFADKVPGVDSAWDSLHTFIRIPAGAMLAAGAVGDVTPAVEIAAGILGGGVAAGSHATKAGTRLLVNTSPEPFSNWGLSLLEDIAVFGGIWAALHQPYVFLGLFILFVLIVIWLLPRLWRGIKMLLRAVGRLFGITQAEPPPDVERSELDEIGKLKSLLDSGAISKEEFERKKTRLLTL